MRASSRIPGTARALRARHRLGRRTRPARARRDRHHLRRERPDQGACRRRKASGLIALADDSGLSVDALDGEPGVYTADWAETPNGRDFAVGMRRVEDALQAAGANEPGRAQGRLQRHALPRPSRWPRRALCRQGRRHHRLAAARRAGLGFDPMFMPDGFDITFGEMPSPREALLGAGTGRPQPPRPRLRPVRQRRSGRRG